LDFQEAQPEAPHHCQQPFQGLGLLFLDELWLAADMVVVQLVKQHCQQRLGLHKERQTPQDLLQRQTLALGETVPEREQLGQAVLAGLAFA
jgi:hypothetical protein